MKCSKEKLGRGEGEGRERIKDGRRGRKERNTGRKEKKGGKIRGGTWEGKGEKEGGN